jgi:hypothetical protein
MRQSFFHFRATAAAIGMVGLLSSAAALADEDLLGLYLGASAGQGRVKASPGSLVTSRQGEDTLVDAADFNATHSAFKVTAGLRPIPLLGAEVSYIDFGHPLGHLGAAQSDVDLKGAAAFAVAYLPVPLFDIVVKAGLARLDNTLSGSGSFVQVGSDVVKSSLFRLSRTNTNFAVGGGLQYSIGPLALRAEYERFEAAGGSPSLLTAGVAWTF